MKKVFKKIIYLLSIIVLLTNCKKDETKPDTTVNYTNFKILSVKVTAMPFLNDQSTSWDFTTGPDVFFKIETANNAVLFDGTSSRFENVPTTGLPIAWNMVNAYQITNITVTHFITLYDYDTPDPDDEIGYVGFTMQDHKSGYPKTITKSNGDITITITGEWY